MRWPSLRTQPGHIVKTRPCPCSARCLVMGPPIPHGESTGVTIYEGEERREDRAGDWVKVPSEAQRKVVGRRLDQSWKISVDVSKTVPPQPWELEHATNHIIVQCCRKGTGLPAKLGFEFCLCILPAVGPWPHVSLFLDLIALI